MTYAAITGWGAAMPPAVLSNADLSTFLDTNDEWITSRTGMKERRISHVSGIEMATVATTRALACAGLDRGRRRSHLYGSCSNDEPVPNSASGVQTAARRDTRRGDGHQHGLHQLPVWPVDGHGYDPHRHDPQRRGDRRRAHLALHGLEQPQRRRAVRRRLRGCRGAGVRTRGRRDRRAARLRRRCAPSLRVRGMGSAYCNHDVVSGDTSWDFDGQAIFNRAVQGMAASTAVHGQVRRQRRRHRSRGPPSSQPAHHRGRRQAAPASRWTT